MCDDIKNDLGHIKIIREEANSVKDCFTRFSFQAIAFFSIIIVAVLRYQKEYPLVSLTLILGILFLLIISQIGTYKYTTANRNYGFELYLRDALKPTNLKMMIWEEALRAWRIVQASIFQSLYYTSGFFKKYKLVKLIPHENIWFEPKSLLSKEVKYYAGGYLRTILTLHKWLSILGLVPFAFPLLYHLYEKGEFNIANITILDWGLVVIAFLLLVYILLWFKMRFRILGILEGGILSIFSCGIMWQVVGICHYEASMKSINIFEYTTNLSKLCEDISQNPKDIPSWIDGKTIELGLERVLNKTIFLLKEQET